MGKWILGQFNIFMIFLLCVYVCDSQEQSLNTYTISTSSYARTVLRPYDWRYIRGTNNFTPLMYLLFQSQDFSTVCNGWDVQNYFFLCFSFTWDSGLNYYLKDLGFFCEDI